jgi:predicted enzyme related to lactoylglutathione lyase
LGLDAAHCINDQYSGRRTKPARTGINNTNHGDITMAKALGVGGIFFKSKDPSALMAWYRKALQFPGDGDYVPFRPGDIPAGGCTVFSPFKADSDYFAPSSASYMFNLMVDELDGAMAQVQAAGGTLVGEIQSYDNGRFGWFVDPDGNKVELWEPKPMG